MNTVERKRARKTEIKEMYNSESHAPSGNTAKANKTINLGIMAGITMALYLVVLEMSMGGGAGAIIYFQYLFLAVFIFLALRENKRAKAAGKVFQRGLSIGATVSAISGLILSLTALVFSAIMPEYSLDQFGLTDNNIARQVVSSFGMALETFVFGMIITFIFLQFMKESSSSTPSKV